MLGEQLRRARDKAELSGMQTADATGISQSKISKIETGLLLPSPEDLEKLCAAYELSKRQTNTLLEQLRAIRKEYVSWRIAHRGGFSAKQRDVGMLEQNAKEIRLFQLSVIPGLLQIPKYARCVIALSNVTGQADLDTAVVARIQRQSILYNPDKHFDFVMTESALSSRFCPAEIVIQQLDRLQLFFDLENVNIGFLPISHSLPTVPQNSFVLYDQEYGVVETTSAEVPLHDERDIEMYLSLFHKLKSAAVHGNDAIAFLNELKQRLRAVA